MQEQTIARVNLAALRANFRTLARLAAPAEVMGIVKANAYGHGAVQVSRCLAREGVKTFAVATLAEAAELSQSGIRQDILVLGVIDPQRIGEVLALGHVLITVHGADHARDCLDAARAARRASAAPAPRLRCHLKVDTGMGRLGAWWRQATDVGALVAASPDATLEGVMTHTSHADNADLSHTEFQLANLRGVVSELQARGLRPPMIHAANSAVLLRCPQGRFTAVRPGLALYGYSSCPEHTAHVALQPVMEVRTTIALIKDVPPGQGVSYAHSWRAAVPSRVAILPIGYADGYRRGLANKAVVRVAGQLAPIVGNVCMDMILADVTAVPQARVGSTVVVLEADPASPLSAHAWAGILDTITYEVFTCLGPRVPRVYVDGP